METANTIAIRKGLIVAGPTPSSKHENSLAMSLQAELMNLGFILSEQAFHAVAVQSRDWIVAYHNEVVPYLRTKMGADREYTPFYRNFPEQVMEMSHFQLFLNAITHYWSLGKWEPDQIVRDRGYAFEDVQFRTVNLGSDADFNRLFTKMVAINQSLTQDDKDTVEWFLKNRRTNLVLPAVIPFKETLCQLAAHGLDVPVKTPTDVLRIAVHMSGGDISLPGVPKVTVKNTSGSLRYFMQTLRDNQIAARDGFKFKKFTRSQRKLILGLLEKTNPTIVRLTDGEESDLGGSIGEMQARLGRWLRLGEVVHPGEFVQKFPKSAAAFKALRNQPPKVRTYAGQVDSAFKESMMAGLLKLQERPGEFARRLDWLLRTYKNPTATEIILSLFSECASKVSSKVLFELWNHFDGRSKSSVRSIIIKGKRAKAKTLEPLPAMDPDLIGSVKITVMGVIKKALAQLEPLHPKGKSATVWIDPRLKKVPVPFAMRSVNTAIKTYVRGTRIPFRADAKVVRPFIHWFDEDGSEDLDLSVGFYADDLSQVTHISFTNLKEQLLGACHSGDVRMRKGACAEYVDIPVQRCLDKGVRYALVQVHNFQQRPMHSLKDCVFGLMERESAESNKTFVPKTITNCMGVANESSSVIVCILDLKERDYIWADVESERGLPTFETTAGKSSEVLRSLVGGCKISVYDLLAAHAEARGMLLQPAEPGKTVLYSEGVDVSFNWEDFVTDYAKVASYMTF